MKEFAYTVHLKDDPALVMPVRSIVNIRSRSKPISKGVQDPK